MCDMLCTLCLVVCRDNAEVSCFQNSSAGSLLATCSESAAACAMQTALEAVAPGGTIGIIGLGQERCCVPIMQAVFKEANVLGMFR